MWHDLAVSLSTWGKCSAMYLFLGRTEYSSRRFETLRATEYREAFSGDRR